MPRLLIATFFLAGLSFGSTPDYYKETQRFNEILSKVRQYYINNPEMKNLIEGAIHGMLSRLDPYSAYMPPKIKERFDEEITQKFVGVGISISIRESWLTVISPIEGTPADRAGIIAGDRLTRIDGISSRGITLENAVKKIRGPRGTKVVLTIYRAGVGETFDIEIVRDEIGITSVPYAFLFDDEVGYLKIKSFGANTFREVESALRMLKARGMSKLVLDLRSNPGGPLNQAVKIGGIFVGGGKTIVSVRGRLPGNNRDLPSHETKEEFGLPLVVLVDGGSASASEIVAGAIQDYDKGIIVGEKTFGKGTVQQIYGLSLGGSRDGSALKLTVANYYTPSGRCIHRDLRLNPQVEIFTNFYYVTNEESGGLDRKTRLETNVGVFQTLVTSRTVRGGGGIEPDIYVRGVKLSPFLIRLRASGEIFSWAVKYLENNEFKEGPFEINYEDILSFKNNAAEYFDKKKLKWEEQEWNKGINIILAYLKNEVFRAARKEDDGYRYILKLDHQFLTAYDILRGKYKMAMILENILLGKI